MFFAEFNATKYAQAAEARPYRCELNVFIPSLSELRLSFNHSMHFDWLYEQATVKYQSQLDL